MRQVAALPLVLLAFAGCGGDAPAPPPAPTATATPVATATPGRLGTAVPSVTRGDPRERAVRRALVAWYEAVRDQDGARACALMTPRARAFYTENFQPAGRTCAGFFGPGGSRLFAGGARFSAGAARAADVAIAPGGRVAVTSVLDDTQPLRRVGGRWLVDQP